MQQREEIRLTPQAKELARTLVAAWDQGQLDQQFNIRVLHGYGRVVSAIVFSDSGTSKFPAPDRGLLWELSGFDLLQMIQAEEDLFKILLLQKLRDAVENDFIYFREVSLEGAIGTIIYGNLTVSEGAIFSSSGHGDVSVTIQTLPDELVKLLGSDALNPNIAAAIQALKTADEPTRLEKAGKVIEELGRGLGHLSNTGGALAAITMIARMLSGGGL